MAEFSFLEDDNNPKSTESFDDDIVAKFIKSLEDQGVVVNKEMMEPEPIAPLKHEDVEFPSVTIQMATNNSDFIININPKASGQIATQGIKNNQNNIIMQFIGVLQKYVPDYLQVKIIPPAKEYDIAIFTIKIIGALDALGFEVSVLVKDLPNELYAAWGRGLK